MKLSQITESFVISNDEFEDYLNRTTEQLAQELQSGKNARDAIHDLALQFSAQHNKAYEAYVRMSDALTARMHTLELDAPSASSPEMGMEPEMGAPELGDEMGGEEPEMMTDPMGDMEMDTPADDEMPSDSDMDDYAAVMDNEPKVEESVSEDRVKVKVVFRKFPDGDVIALFPEEDEGRGMIGSYMTVGQHSEASKSLITDLEPASKEEYADLAAELGRIGYDIVMAESVNEASCGCCGNDPCDCDDDCDCKKVDESGILYKAGVKKYGKEGMKKIQSASGKGASAEEIGKIKDQHRKKKTNEGRMKDSVIHDSETMTKAEFAKKHGKELADEMYESVNESMEVINKIVADKQAGKLHGMTVDMFTASAIKQIYDAVSDANKEKLDDLMSSKEGVVKAAGIAMKMMKEGKMNELSQVAGMAMKAMSGIGRAAGAASGMADKIGKVSKFAKGAGKAYKLGKQGVNALGKGIDTSLGKTVEDTADSIMRSSTRKSFSEYNAFYNELDKAAKAGKKAGDTITVGGKNIKLKSNPKQMHQLSDSDMDAIDALAQRLNEKGCSSKYRK